MSNLQICGFVMDETTLKPRDLIRSAFSSRVAVLCTTAAEELLRQYNLSFTQLAQPFSKLTCDASWQDPNSQLILVKDLYLTLVDISNWKKPEVDTQKTRRLLSSIVTQTPPPLQTSSATELPDFKTVTLDSKSSSYQVRLPGRTTWFESWRKSFLKCQSEVYGSQHEFLNHFVACVLVISSSEVKSSEDVANTVGKLSKLQQQHQYDHPNTWILPSVLKYYLIVQDSGTPDEEAERVYQNFRTMYGGNFCHLLKFGVEKDLSEAETLSPNPWSYLAEQEVTLMDVSITENDQKISESEEAVENIVQSELLHPLSLDSEKPPSIISQNGELPNGVKNKINGEYGKALNQHDVRRIQLSINEFICKALLPYMERQCRNLNESIMNRRGMSKSFFSATKRLFGTTSKSTPSIVYASESVEILGRKLGDIYFLFGHYGGAYQLYHQLKKDFYGDAAWLYYSSALELAAISHFMMSQSEPPLAVARAFPVHYVNDAIGHFIDQCRMVDAATRCAIICAECLKQLDNHAEAAAIFIRMTSEDCDLRSALMLEQAAYCFIEMNSPRKYALHSVLAGYRYAKAGLKSHSLNCYRQSYQIYNGRGWRCAEDHVNFTIARLQNVLQIPEGVTKHLMSTLVSPTPQPPQQIQTFYKEFLTTMSATFKPSSTEPFEFFIPTIRFSEMQIRIAVTGLETGECESEESDEENISTTNWESLEEQVVRECLGKSVIKFKPSRLLFSRVLDNTVSPSVPCDEIFYVELPFFNQLKIPLLLRNITLKFDQDKFVDVNTISDLELESEVSKTLRFAVVCHKVGLTTLEAVYYELEHTGNRVAFQQKVHLKGPRLNGTKAERLGKIYAKDLRNKIIVTDRMPLFQASVQGLSKTFFNAQTANFEIILEEKSNFNTADMSLSKLVIGAENMDETLQILSSESVSSGSSFQVESTGKKFTQLFCKGYNPKMSIPCIYKAPQSGDTAVLEMLVLYEIVTRSQQSAESEKRKHRVTRVSLQIPLSPAVHVEYSSLKMLDCFTYLGLLRLYNLTVDYNISVNKIFFTPNEVNIIDLCSAKLKEVEDSSNRKDAIIKMNKNESRNIVLQFQDSRKLTEIPRSDISVNVQWGIEGGDSIAATEGSSRIKIQEAIVSIESSFIFQVKHPNRIYGDFANSSVQSCNIDLKIHSRTSGNFNIQLENNPPKEDITSTGPSSRGSGDIFLMGKTSWKLELSAQKTETVTYSMGVAWPGVYNAAPFIIVTDVDRGVQETYSLHSPIIVAQSSPSPIG